MKSAEIPGLTPMPYDLEIMKLGLPPFFSRTVMEG